jgi:integrase
MKIPTPPYKLADVFRCESEWYVYYSYKHPVTQKFERFKESTDLNKKDNIPFREVIAQQIVDLINEELKKGFNPFNSEKVRVKYGLDTMSAPESIQIPIRKPEPSLPVLTTIDLAKHQIQLIVNAWGKTESYSQTMTYRQMNTRFKKYLNSTCSLDITLSEIDYDFASNFQLYLKAHMKLAPKTVNTTISHVGMFFDELKTKKKITDNPFRTLEHVSKKSYRGIQIDLDNEDSDFIPFTSVELDTVFKYLANNARHLLRFFGLTYWGFMRPVEITRLQISDIDLIAGTIRVKKPDAKNKSSAYVQILQPMRVLLEEMNLEKYPSNFYLFTSKKMVPGPELYCPDLAALHWKEIVHAALHIYKKPYSLKHTGNIHYILNNKGNVDREWMKMQNRHKTRAQTDKYIERLNIYTIDETKYNFRQLPNNLVIDLTKT